MQSIVDNANYKNKQFTENGLCAYGWSKDNRIREKSIQEHIVQFYFQCVLDNTNVQLLQNKYHELFEMVLKMNDDSVVCKYVDYLIRLAIQTRDIEMGKGMYNMAYHMFEVIVHHVYDTNVIDKNTYFKMFRRVLNESSDGDMPYGSWKDLKHFLQHLYVSKKYESNDRNHIIHEHITRLYLEQMIQDRKAMSVGDGISLCGKWLPRESSKVHRWLARSIARAYYNIVFSEVPEKMTIYSQHYRELCTKFNKYIDTTQIHMCRRTWDVIDFDHVTALTLHKFKNAFMNSRNINEEHRNICRDNLINYVADKVENGESMKAKVLYPHQLVGSVLYPSELLDETSQGIINLQWHGLVENVKQNMTCGNNFLQNCIPCIDVSPSMYHRNTLPLLASIGMGIMAMECSTIKRSFTFSEIPKWINFNENMTFVEKVAQVRESEWGNTTDIYVMFIKLLEFCVSNKVSNEEVGNYSLFVFSDMQFNDCCMYGATAESTLVESVNRLFYEQGYTNIPYIIFWNLRTTNNFPSISKIPGCTMLSGNSASLFKFFMNTTLEEVKNMTNWTLIKTILDNKRYTINN
jgi:hypothetical protein